jgi:flagellar biosynthesis protein FlhB
VAEGSEEDQEQRSEAASERRLQHAFEEGDVPLSNEAVTLAAWLCGVGAAVALAGTLSRQLQVALAESVRQSPWAPFGALPSLLGPPALTVGTVLGATALGAVVATAAQTRGMVWFEKASPDFSRVFGWERLTRLFTRQFLLDLLLEVVKVAAVGWTAWVTLAPQLATLGSLALLPPVAQGERLLSLLLMLAFRVTGVLVAFAAGDVLLKRYRYFEKHKMTKEEVRREAKEDEGDPLIKGARRRKHRELAKAGALAETKRADVLVDPTHIAIALRYRKDEGGAPRVLAKGKGALAEAMREVARSLAIPIVQDVPLARLLYKQVKVGRTVPQDSYKAVAAVMAIVYRMTGRTPGR